MYFDVKLIVKRKYDMLLHFTHFFFGFARGHFTQFTKKLHSQSYDRLGQV